MIAEGDRVAIRSTMSGTHQGEFMGLPPTGKRFSVTAVEIVRFQDSLLVDHWGATDSGAMLQQLGIIGAPS